MLLTKQIFLIPLLRFSLSQHFLPELPNTDIQVPGFEDQFEHVIPDHESLKKRNVVLQPRGYYPATAAFPNLVQNVSPAMVKRMLLGRQYTCEPGYSLCRNSGRCCPDPYDSGRCCQDGTCVTSLDTCCVGGEACPAGYDCCRRGCKPTENTCCSDNYSCEPGYKCCGNRSCAPLGGECCSNGRVCAKGLRCVIIRGIYGCCRDLSCSEFDTDDDNTYSSAQTRTRTLSPFTPSFTVVGEPTVTVPTIILPTLPTTAAGIGYRYYTRTITWYFTYFFITTVSTTPTPTSTVTYTTTTVSVYATASTEARSILSSITASVSFPSSVTAIGYTDATATSGNTGTAGSSTTRSQTSGANTEPSTETTGTSGAGKVDIGIGGFFVVLVMVFVAIGSGLGMLVL